MHFQAKDTDPGPDPPDLSRKLISLVPPVMFDLTPWNRNFGECIKQPPASVKIGHTVSVKFVSILYLGNFQ